MKSSSHTRKLKAQALIEVFSKLYPDAHCALHYESPFQLLVATILSAQCTDVRVNQVTPKLFKRFPDVWAMARASTEEVEKLIASTGFFRSKAKAILESSQMLVEQYNGELPNSIEALTKLRGVGRKTANVVLGEVFGIQEGIVVDTHVGRLSRRLGLTRSHSALVIERDLMKTLPQEHWTQWSHWLIAHGRSLCKARKPQCGACPLIDVCPHGIKTLASP